MKLNKTLLAGFIPALALSLLLASCDAKDEPIYTPAPTPTDAQRVHFLQSSMTMEVQQQEVGSFDIALERVKGTEAQPLTVQLVATSSTPAIIGAGITVPTSATFAEGETSTIVTVTYDSKAMDVATPYDIAIALAENGNEYSVSTLNLRLQVSPFTPWAPFANATGAGSIHLNILYEEVFPCTVSYRESTLDPAAKEYRVEVPDALDEPFYITTQDDGKTLSIAAQGVLTHPEYGVIQICDLVNYKKNPGYAKYNYYDPATRTFNYAVIYYVPAGSFGNGLESITMAE